MKNSDASTLPLSLIGTLSDGGDTGADPPGAASGAKTRTKDSQNIVRSK
jgi:hypothetical protein